MCHIAATADEDRILDDPAVRLMVNRARLSGVLETIGTLEALHHIEMQTSDVRTLSEILAVPYFLVLGLAGYDDVITDTDIDDYRDEECTGEPKWRVSRAIRESVQRRKEEIIQAINAGDLKGKV